MGKCFIIMRKEHGNYSLCIDEQIIYLEVFGPWNEESSKSCINEIKFMFLTKQYENLAVIVNTIKLEGLTPEAFNLWFSAIDFFYENGHNYVVRVDDESSIFYKLFSHPFDKINKERMNFKFAKTTQDGINILKDSNYKGFEIGFVDQNCIKNDN